MLYTSYSERSTQTPSVTLTPPIFGSFSLHLVSQPRISINENRQQMDKDETTGIAKTGLRKTRSVNGILQRFSVMISVRCPERNMRTLSYCLVTNPLIRRDPVCLPQTIHLLLKPSKRLQKLLEDQLNQNPEFRVS